MKYKYEVYNPEGEYIETPKFETYEEALEAQKLWNKTFPGHVARKIRTSILKKEYPKWLSP